MINPQEVTPLEQEMHIIACRLREKYDLDSVALLACKQETVKEGYATNRSFAVSGNDYAARHMARRFSET